MIIVDVAATKALEEIICWSLVIIIKPKIINGFFTTIVSLKYYFFMGFSISC